MVERLYSFIGGSHGAWIVTGQTTITGEPLTNIQRIEIVNGPHSSDGTTTEQWCLQGVTSNERYVTRDEKRLLSESQPTLGRPNATCAALIPIRKNPSWWTMAQDERREILEANSLHIKTGMQYLPAIARRLHHCRDLTGLQPFDFLTWFEFAPQHEGDFEQLLLKLRATQEWSFIDREIDIRLVRS